MATSTIPIHCVEPHPTKQTVYFVGVAINLSAVARSYDPPIDLGYLSRIFKGQRVPSVELVKQIAEALGMSLQALCDGLEQLREGTDGTNRHGESSGEQSQGARGSGAGQGPSRGTRGSLWGI